MAIAEKGSRELDRFVNGEVLARRSHNRVADVILVDRGQLRNNRFAVYMQERLNGKTKFPSECMSRKEARKEYRRF